MKNHEKHLENNTKLYEIHIKTCIEKLLEMEIRKTILNHWKAHEDIKRKRNNFRKLRRNVEKLHNMHRNVRKPYEILRNILEQIRKALKFSRDS